MISSAILLLALALNVASSSLAAPIPILRGADVVARPVTRSLAPEARDFADFGGPGHRFIRRRLPADIGMIDSKAVRDVDAKAAIAGRQPLTKETIVITSASLTTIEKIHDDGSPGGADGPTGSSSRITVHVHGKHRHGKHCPFSGSKRPHGSCTCKHLCSDGQCAKMPDKEDPDPAKGPTGQDHEITPTSTTSGHPSPSDTPTATTSSTETTAGPDKPNENGDIDGEQPAPPESSGPAETPTDDAVKEEPVPKVVPSLVPTADKLKVLSKETPPA